jgi:hypothetical protein
VVDEGPRGAPPYQNLETAYAELLTGLWYALHLFKTENDAGREGVRTACHAVARFIAVRHENPELAAPFLAIRQALIDLDSGVESELLSRRGAKERSRSGQRVHLHRLASVCLEVLVEMNEPLEIAANYVARNVNRWPGIGPQEVTGNTIQNWRERERREFGPERAKFDVLRAELLQLDNPKGEVDRLLRGGPPGIPES